MVSLRGLFALTATLGVVVTALPYADQQSVLGDPTLPPPHYVGQEAQGCAYNITGYRGLLPLT